LIETISPSINNYHLGLIIITKFLFQRIYFERIETNILVKLEINLWRLCLSFST